MWPVFLLVVSCGPSVEPATVDTAACAAIEATYTEAANRIIDTGQCDKHDRIEDCVPYRAVESMYVTAAARLRCP